MASTSTATTPIGPDLVPGFGPRPRRGRLLRLRVFWHRWGLDKRIARGAHPSESPELGLRAEQLLRGRTRRDIARGLERVVAVAEAKPKPGMSSMAPVQRREVNEARGAILSLAHALRAGSGLNPRGIAEAEILITDFTSPLYTPAAPGTLLEVAQRARDHLLRGPRI